MQDRIRCALVVLAALALVGPAGGCSGIAESLGFGKRSPDEFSVVNRAPLVLPPNYNLRPPQPGASRPQELAPSQAARAALVTSAGGSQASGSQREPAPPQGQYSRGEEALLRSARADAADPNIRAVIERETTALVEKSQSFTDRLLFWRTPQPPGEIVDPKAEATRIRENQAAGRPLSAGSTPVIRHRKRGLLEGIF